MKADNNVYNSQVSVHLSCSVAINKSPGNMEATKVKVGEWNYAAVPIMVDE